MDRKELTAKLSAMAREIQVEHPNAAIVLLVLCATMDDFTDARFAELAQEVARGSLKIISS